MNFLTFIPQDPQICLNLNPSYFTKWKKLILPPVLRIHPLTFRSCFSPSPCLFYRESIPFLAGLFSSA